MKPNGRFNLRRTSKKSTECDECKSTKHNELYDH